MKKYVLLLLVFAMFLGMNLSSYATTDTSVTSKEIIQAISFEELATLPIDQAYSYEEMIEDKYINGLITREEFQEKINEHRSSLKANTTNSRGIVLYTKFTLDSYEFSKGLFRYELTPIMYVGLYYSSSGSPDHIDSIEDPYIRTSDGASCEFAGSIFYRLESGNSFYYGVNGDVYKTATTTTSGGGTINIGKSATINFNVTYSNDFLKNVDFDGRYYSRSLNP